MTDKNNDITVPINTNETCKGTGTPPWIVQKVKYAPRLATYKPLVNGEEAFAAVYNAIEKAQKSVDIICWGFQPSMYFIRDGLPHHYRIGELLVTLARRNIRVRILGWESPFNVAGIGGEANLPGVPGIKNRAGQTSTDAQFDYDRQWFRNYFAGRDKVKTREKAEEDLKYYTETYTDYRPDREIVLKTFRETFQKNFCCPEFVGRGFNPLERIEMMNRAKYDAEGAELSTLTRAALGGIPTHHQKTVLVDYELPEVAVGFVMGHNMLDEYWDTDAHTSKHRTEEDRLPPNLGPRGSLPRQDISAIVTGPILEYLHDNFAVAWYRATGEDLLTKRHAAETARQLRMRPEFGTPLIAQLLRTQSQEEYKKELEDDTKDKFEDIKKYYLQMVPKATQFIYIENQYFRWQPLAESIVKEAAGRQTKGGRDPRYHGNLHLFVISNVLDEGIGNGTLNTWRMLDILGRKDAIPEIARLQKLEQLKEEFYHRPQPVQAPAADMKKTVQNLYQAHEQRKKEWVEYDKKAEELKTSKMLPEARPGLKIHVCSLVAADSPPDNWMPVYIHSKLMIIDDVFTTHGSANINARSMQVDSEMNISHDWMSATRDLRRRLWNSHTAGKGTQDDAEAAFDEWEYILNENSDRQATKKAIPLAPLIKFLYDKPNISDLD